MSEAKNVKTYSSLWEELCDLPENVVGEIFNDELVVSPRPAPKHAVTSSSLGEELIGPFQKGKNGGPGGWWIIGEPELHFKKPVQKREKKNTVVPDLAGWKVSPLARASRNSLF